MDISNVTSGNTSALRTSQPKEASNAKEKPEAAPAEKPVEAPQKPVESSGKALVKTA